VDDNIWKIQELYKNEEQMKKLNNGEVVENEEVILIKLYKVSRSTSSITSSFIDNEVNNLDVNKIQNSGKKWQQHWSRTNMTLKH